MHPLTSKICGLASALGSFSPARSRSRPRKTWKATGLQQRRNEMASNKTTALISMGIVLLLPWPSLAGPQVVTADQVNGTWKDQTKIFRIWALGNERLKLEFQGTYEYK